MLKSNLLQDVLRLPEKGGLGPHRVAIIELRRRGYSWREVATFLTERGVATDHTKLFRFMNRNGGIMKIPSAAEYKVALSAAKPTAIEKKMLERHYLAHNRTVTYTQLAKAVSESKTFRFANAHYGRFGAKLGAALDFPFVDLNPDKGTKFQSSAIGMGIPAAYSSCNDFELVMHHELAKALQELNWFPAK